MKIIILAGGLGSRLRPLTFAIPKPLVPVGEKPILEHLLKCLQAQGFDEFYLAVGYKAELIETYFQDGSAWGVHLHYCRESERLGTAGPIRMLSHQFGFKERLLVMNADIFTQLQFKNLIAFHEVHQSIFTFGIRYHQYTLPFGELHLDGPTVRGIQEKPTHQYAVSAGIYVIEPQALDSLPPSGPCDMPVFVQNLIDRNMKVCGYEIKEKWNAIETLADLENELKDQERTGSS
ncbi:MAG: sugar phosphate nucleotidyltransferase [Acidobacteriia bacterium]|nr:sugar phosphate nucleotidyltransferase [Terriglobia bacterium]